MRLISSFIVILLLSMSSYGQGKPANATVNSIQIDGSGCDAGSAQAAVTDDLNFLSVIYDRFTAEIGEGTEKPQAKQDEKNCAILVNVSVPQGWTFDIDSIEYRGYVEVPHKGAVAYQNAMAAINGGAGMSFERIMFKGPRVENYSLLIKNKPKGNSQAPGLIGQVLGGGMKMKKCSKKDRNVRIMIRSQIGVRNVGASVGGKLGQLLNQSGLAERAAVRIVVDTTDAAFRQNLKLNWRQCNED